MPGTTHLRHQWRRFAVDLVANDASNVIPAQFTADMVTLVRDRATGQPLLLIVIEPQGTRRG